MIRKTLAVLTTCAAVALLLGPGSADARPNYKKALEQTYELNDKVSCGGCHGNGGKNKKVVSEYGEAMKEALGAKNVKDMDEIVAALKAIESKGDVDGKTYGEVLATGELPPPAE